MYNLFEITDKSGKRVRLTKTQWTHIVTSHAEMTNYLDLIEQTLTNPLKMTFHEIGNLRKYYSYHKHRKYSEKYLRVIVKYLNGDGFVITAHFVRNIK